MLFQQAHTQRRRRRVTKDFEEARGLGAPEATEIGDLAGHFILRKAKEWKCSAGMKTHAGDIRSFARADFQRFPYLPGHQGGALCFDDSVRMDSVKSIAQVEHDLHATIR